MYELRRSTIAMLQGPVDPLMTRYQNAAHSPYRKLVPLAILYFYACATLQFVRFYTRSTDFYLNLSAYLTGHERLPFQERILPALFMRSLYHSAWIMRHAHADGAFTQERGPFYVLSLLSLLVAAIYTQRLYHAVTRQHLLGWLVYPLFLLAVMWSYTIHSEANYSYPYDLPAVAFFAAGLFYIYKRNFRGVFTVVLIGSFNRETTLFLIGIYVIDAASRSVFPWVEHRSHDMRSLATWIRRRFDLHAVPWGRVALLAVVWVSIKLWLGHLFAQNDRSEDFLRLHYNMRLMKPRLIPALLNICGYMIPVAVLCARLIRPVRFQNYLLILPVWFAVMFCSGVLVETRIYGELCSFSAVALVLVLEEYAARTLSSRRMEEIDAPDTAPQLAA